MSVWYCIPSARPAAEVEKAMAWWRFRGYKVALFRDEDAKDVPGVRNIHGKYLGYAKAVNLLARIVLADDPDCGWVVTGGDDILPDPCKSADEIARECEVYFGGTLGVMQPTGDRHLEEADGRCAAERVCVSPWLGRDWCERGYNGRGPLCEEYFHFFVDEDLHNVATRLGLLWHRVDICQHHNFWGRTPGNPRPEHLKRAAAQWKEARDLFFARKAAGFPRSSLARVNKRRTA